MALRALTLVTPTGDRPDAFGLLTRWVRAQDFEGDIRWIVVDDGAEPLAPPQEALYIRRPRNPGEPDHTLVLQLLCALDQVAGDGVLFLEDDDYYSPRYVRLMANLLERHPIAGEGLARYYSVVNGRYRRCRNKRHASLAQTGIRADLLPLLEGLLTSNPADPAIDAALWKRASSGLVFLDEEDRLRLHCGIKNMPGRPSTMKSHGNVRRRGIRDPDGQILRRWVGATAFEAYRPFIRGID